MKKKKRRKNPIAKDLRTPKYKMRIVAYKRRKVSEREAKKEAMRAK